MQNFLFFFFSSVLTNLVKWPLIANFMIQCGSDIVWELVVILYHFCDTKIDDLRGWYWCVTRIMQISFLGVGRFSFNDREEPFFELSPTCSIRSRFSSAKSIALCGLWSSSLSSLPNQTRLVISRNSQPMKIKHFSTWKKDTGAETV